MALGLGIYRLTTWKFVLSSAEGLGQNFNHNLVGSANLKAVRVWQVLLFLLCFVVLLLLLLFLLWLL